MAKWTLELNNLPLGGFAPAWYKETYPSYGNKNQAGAMTNIDMTNAGFITQGPGLANLTNGTQAAAVTTLIKGMTQNTNATSEAWGVGGSKFYKITAGIVVSDANFPHTINKATVTGEDGEDAVVYRGSAYYSYNHSGGEGDVGVMTSSTTFDDDFMSTVPSGADNLIGGVPHPMCVGGNDFLYIGNDSYVASYFDNTGTFQDQALDLGGLNVIASLAWHNDRLCIAANEPNVTGVRCDGSIFVWNGTSTSWETEIVVGGRVGALMVRGGTLLVFYQDVTNTGGYKLGYVNGSTVVDIANFTGALPLYYQVSEYKDFIVWNSNGSIFAYGSGDKDLPARLFQYCDGGYATAGGMTTALGSLYLASFDGGTNYKLAQLSGYDVASSWKSLMFDITGGRTSRINDVRINFEALASGARVDWSLKNNQGLTIYSDTISFSKLGAATSAFYPLNGKVAENLRVEFDFANGSASNSVKIKNIKVNGESD